MEVSEYEYISKAGFNEEVVAVYAKRIENDDVSCPCSYEKYAADKTLAATIKLLKLDACKFWHLIQFAYDYTSDVCNNGTVTEEGGYEMMWMLIDYGRRLMNGEKPTPLKTDASCTFRLQGRNYKVKNTDSIATLLYWIHLGMIKMNTTDPIWELNWLIDDFEQHTRPVKESSSVTIWCFASLLLRFFKTNRQFAGRAPKGSMISLNKQLLISKIIYMLKLSRNDNFQYSDETLKGFLRQYRNRALPSQGRWYGTLKGE